MPSIVTQYFSEPRPKRLTTLSLARRAYRHGGRSTQHYGDSGITVTVH